MDLEISGLRLVLLPDTYSAPSSDKRVVFQESAAWETEISAEGDARTDRVAVVAHYDTELRLAVFSVYRGEKPNRNQDEFEDCESAAFVAAVPRGHPAARVQRVGIALYDRALAAQQEVAKKVRWKGVV